MNIEHLRYLVTVADCQSISHASEKLLLKQQYLSTLVASLEKHFGTKIFERNYRGVTLTPNGQYLIEQMRSIVSASDHLMLSYLYPDNQYHCTDKLDIQLYSSPQLSYHNINAALLNFQSVFTNVNLTFTEQTDTELIQSLLTTPMSIGLFSTPICPDTVKNTLPTQLAAFPLKSVKMVALTSKSNAQAQQITKISCTELLKKNLIIYTNDTVHDSLIYKTLLPYGELVPKYIAKNATLYLSALQSTNYYSLGEPSLAKRHNLLAIPLKEDIQTYLILLINTQFLEHFIYKNLINIFLSYYGCSPI